MEISRLCVIGYIGPATAPCKARKTISSVILVDMPQRNDVITNKMVQILNRRTSPKRRLRKPVSGRVMALLTAKEVMIQVLCDELTPRLPAMVGNDTLAIVVSRTCMKVARHRPRVVSHRLAGANGCAGVPGGAALDFSLLIGACIIG